MRGLMVAAHGRGRLPEVVSGSGWPIEALKTTTRTAALENRVWPFWAIVGAPAMVLAVAGGSGAVGSEEGAMDG